MKTADKNKGFLLKSKGIQILKKTCVKGLSEDDYKDQIFSLLTEDSTKYFQIHT